MQYRYNTQDYEEPPPPSRYDRIINTITGKGYDAAKEAGKPTPAPYTRFDYQAAWEYGQLTWLETTVEYQKWLIQRELDNHDKFLEMMMEDAQQAASTPAAGESEGG